VPTMRRRWTSLKASRGSTGTVAPGAAQDEPALAEKAMK
jgi:hypothetical protein